jgi:hypothetical protein
MKNTRDSGLSTYDLLKIRVISFLGPCKTNSTDPATRAFEIICVKCTLDMTVTDRVQTYELHQRKQFPNSHKHFDEHKRHNANKIKFRV